MTNFNKYNFIVTEDNEEERLDKFIAENMLNSDKYSRSYIQKLIKDSNILVNKKVKKSSYKININDEIIVNVPEPVEYNIESWDKKLDIVYEDNDLIVINKPVDLVVHPAPGHMDNKTLVNALIYHCKDLSGINGILRPGIVHRLDKDTSGLMIAAKNDIAHRGLASQLESRSLSRKYTAVCHGRIKEDSFEFTSQIGRSSKDRKKMTVLKSGGKEAVSHFKVIKYFEKYTMVEVSLKTGRTHQIRVHLSHLGYPIIGDPVYGNKKSNSFGMKRQALHAYKIRFMHPILKKDMEFETCLPSDIKRLEE